MRKQISLFFLVIILFINSQHALGQVAFPVKKEKAQLTPQWIARSQKPLFDKKARIYKKTSDTSYSASLKNSPPDDSQRERPRNKPRYVPGKVFVKFKPATTDVIKPFANQSQRSAVIAEKATKAALSQARVNQMEVIKGTGLSKQEGQIYKASIDESLTVDEALVILEKMPEVEYAEKVPLYHAFYEPNDPAYQQGNQYALDLVQATKAFDKLDIATNEIYVAIVDEAFAYDHPDLVANVAVSKCFDVADNDADTRPPSSGTNKAGPLTFSHGTHVGGIAGAVTSNNLGVASISNNSVKLFGIKATKNNTKDPSNIDFSAEGVRKAIANGARVINMSFGGDVHSKTWQKMINDATAEGVIFVAAAGNGNTSIKNYPAAYGNVIAIANTNHKDIKDPTSHFGDWIDIAAPGTDIYSTVVDSDGTSGAYAFYSGTSMASPMVAGLVGLMLSQNSTLNYNDIISILKSTSDNIDAVNLGYQNKLGVGRINAYNAILVAKGLSVAPEAKFITSDTEIYTGQTVTFSSQSLGNDLTYAWTFDGGSPTSAANTKVVDITYNNPGIYHVSLKVTNSKGSDVATLQNHIIVKEPMDCEMLSFPFPGTRSLYNYTDSQNRSIGPVIGQNEYKASQFANKYEFLPGYYISGGLFAINKAKSKDMERAKVTFKVWEKARKNDIPGKVLASQDVAYKDLVFTKPREDKSNRSAYTEVVFDNPVQVPDDGNFFLGFEIYHEAGDTIVFYTNKNGDGDGNNAYFFFEDGWEAFLSSQFDANIEISPVLMGAAYLNVAPFIAEGGMCAGGIIDFNTQAIKSAVGYNWYFPGGNPTTSTEANPTVTYSEVGEFEAVLLVTLQGCTVGRRKVTQKVRIVNCSEQPEANFTVDRYIVAAGDSIHFLEQSSNATGYSWTFTGGTPLTSSVADPYVTYSKPGIYEVSLEVQNPNGEVSSIVKKDYITVLEPEACGFYTELSFNSPPEGSPTLYYSDDGYTVGTNNTGELGKAAYFKGTNSRAYLNKLEFYFGAAHASSPQSEAEIIIYDDNGINGGPGDLIVSKKMSISDIKKDVDKERPSVVYFDNLAIKGPFYAGISLDLKDEKDTIALISSRDDEVGGASWDQSAKGAWKPTSENEFYPLDIKLHISAFFTKFNMFSAPDCTPLAVNTDKENPKTKVLVFPNPFNGQTNIEYQLIRGGWVKLEIFNSMGQKVTTLIDKQQAIGKHTVVFDALKYPSGLYIYRLSLGGKPVSRGRMVLQ